jgi:hypothetical protein
MIRPGWSLLPVPPAIASARSATLRAVSGSISSMSMCSRPHASTRATISGFCLRKPPSRTLGPVIKVGAAAEVELNERKHETGE